ncbi:hypothetical protein NIE88_17530 [Sporolactobacillus shoreicorticis]|uniref:Teichuronic acid biosynthesis protein TuaF n=1 Tax=Sporolactobacillus shoreicorticis TaxID=1923877 RepID=A0ABW5S3U3_9BACL|nr:hypothetical protein [Sporolactobacillus shoreicorticis]MCO7127561.1 hypothetical protein [Sporolactobacillus shoreicorticis]
MSVFKSVAARLRKYLWIVAALPIILGIVGFFVPAGKMPSSFEAQTTIQLGSYGDDIMNDTSQVIVLLSNAPFYEKRLPELWRQQEQALLSQISVTDLTNRLIQIRYQGTSEAEAAEGVNLVTSAFLDEDKEHFDQKEKIIDEAINTLNKSHVSSNENVSRARFLYKLQMEKAQMRQAQILEPAQKKSGTSVSTISSKKRAVLGFMLGITLVIIGAALPEFVRKKE